jgi:hypothetical protein
LHVTAIEIGLESVHNMDFLRESRRISGDATSVGKNSGTYCCEAFVLVKWIPAKAHYHRVHFTLLSTEAIHLCVAEVNPRFAHAAHWGDGFIRKVR